MRLTCSSSWPTRRRNQRELCGSPRRGKQYGAALPDARRRQHGGAVASSIVRPTPSRTLAVTGSSGPHRPKDLRG
jgi:hypothetical protein